MPVIALLAIAGSNVIYPVPADDHAAALGSNAQGAGREVKHSSESPLHCLPYGCVFDQLESGSNRVIFDAIAVVALPRFFWYTMPS